MVTHHEDSKYIKLGQIIHYIFDFSCSTVLCHAFVGLKKVYIWTRINKNYISKEIWIVYVII